MQAYDLVKLRSTAPCRIVGIAAASEGGAVAGVIGTRQSHMSRSHFRLAGRPANFSASTTSARSRAYPFPLSMAVRASAASENQINQLIKCALDCARAWGRCASPLLSSVMFVPLRAGYDIANQGVKNVTRNWQPSFLRPGCRGRERLRQLVRSMRHICLHPDDAPKREFITTARPRRNFGPQRRQGPTRFLRRAPFLDDRMDAFDHQDGDAAEEAKTYTARPSQMSLIKIKRC